MQICKLNIYIVLLGFCLLCAGKTFSQLSDTIVVYEYIHVVDTVWIEREKPDIRKMSVTDGTTVRCQVGPDGILFCEKSATLAENQILNLENQTQSDIKRKGVLATLLLPFHMVASGQTTMNLFAGNSNMWLEHRTGTVNNPVWTGGHIGTEILFPFKNNRFHLSGGLAFHRVQNTGEYQQIRTIDASLPYWKYEYARLKTLIILNELNTGMFDSPYWQIAVPVKIHYRWSSVLTPFAGVAYRYTRFMYPISDNLSMWSSPSTPVVSFHDFEIQAGTDISISRSMGLRLNISNGFFGKYNHFENEISPLLGTGEYYFKSLNVEVSLLIHLQHRRIVRKTPRHS